MKGKKMPENDDRFYDPLPWPVIQRTYWRKKLVKGEYREPDTESRFQTTPEEANIVSSLLRSGLHAPTLDIDLPCRLAPSSTEGHFHLYIDKAMSWDDYKRMLKVLADVGILEPGYVQASIKRQGTDLRVPGVKK